MWKDVSRSPQTQTNKWVTRYWEEGEEGGGVIMVSWANLQFSPSRWRKGKTLRRWTSKTSCWTWESTAWAWSRPPTSCASPSWRSSKGPSTSRETPPYRYWTHTHTHTRSVDINSLAWCRWNKVYVDLPLAMPAELVFVIKQLYLIPNANLGIEYKKWIIYFNWTEKSHNKMSFILSQKPLTTRKTLTQIAASLNFFLIGMTTSFHPFLSI